MSVENDFLPFAVGNGANVLSQSDYAALAAISTGYQAGTAQSAALNKTWRQSSIMAAVLAQFIADRTGQNSVDDGTTATLLANLKASVAALNGDATQTFNVAAATALTQAPEVGQVQRSAFNYAGLAGGTANALTATLNIAPGSYTDYLVVTVRVASTNTGSVSLNVNGLGVVPVIGLGHQPLQGSELVAGGFATFAYSANFSEAILLEATGGPVQVAPATASQHAVQLGQVQQTYAWFGGMQVISATGTFTVPTGVYRLRYRVWGGGGGSGGCGSAGQTAGGAGGGGYSEGVASVTPGQTVPCTIGAAGTAGGPGGTGGTGGTTSFTAGALTVSATGGSGSSNGIGSGGNGAAGGTGSGGKNNLTGAGGCSGSGSTGGPGGMGGSAPQGGGGGGGATGTAQSGQTPGGGAGGPGAAGANPGAVGGAGRIVFEW